MSKRRLERGLADLGDDLLADLDPDARLQVALEALAGDKAAWLERLAETRPADQTPAVRRRGYAARLLAQQAVYDLHTTVLGYSYCRDMWRVLVTTDDAGPDAVERAATQNERALRLFATLYVDQHVYRRFATETLGVDCETWLAAHPDGPDVIALAADVLDDGREREAVEAWLADEEWADTTSELDEPTLEALVDRRYDALVSTWESCIDSR